MCHSKSHRISNMHEDIQIMKGISTQGEKLFVSSLSFWFEAGCWLTGQSECSCSTCCTSCSSISARVSIYYYYTYFHNIWVSKMAEGTFMDCWSLTKTHLQQGPSRLGFKLENDIQFTFPNYKKCKVFLNVLNTSQRSRGLIMKTFCWLF